MRFSGYLQIWINNNNHHQTSKTPSASLTIIKRKRYVQKIEIITTNKVTQSPAQASLKATHGQVSCCQFTGLAIYWLTASLIPSLCFLDSVPGSFHKLGLQIPKLLGELDLCKFVVFLGILIRKNT